MAAILGVNAVFHDPAAAVVVDGTIVAAAEEERFTRRKHGKVPVPFSTWELPEEAARWCLHAAGVEPSELDAVAYSYDPALREHDGAGDLTAEGWEPLRTLFARRASDEHTVMTLASYGTPRHLDLLREAVRTDGDRRFETSPIDWHALAPPGRGDGTLDPRHADLAASVQRRLEEVLLDLARWLQAQSGKRLLTMAGGVALNCVANSRLFEEGPFDDARVQPAAALGPELERPGGRGRPARGERPARAPGRRCRRGSHRARGRRARRLVPGSQRVRAPGARTPQPPRAPLRAPAPRRLGGARAAVVHVDGTARAQTIDRDAEPLVRRVRSSTTTRRHGASSTSPTAGCRGSGSRRSCAPPTSWRAARGTSRSANARRRAMAGEASHRARRYGWPEVATRTLDVLAALAERAAVRPAPNGLRSR